MCAEWDIHERPRVWLANARLKRQGLAGWLATWRYHVTSLVATFGRSAVGLALVLTLIGAGTWYLTTRPDRMILEGEKGPIPDLVFSPDGKMIASSRGAEIFEETTGKPSPSIRLWRRSDGILVRAFPTQKRALQLTFSPDGHYLAGYDDSDVLVWRVPDGGLLDKIPKRFEGGKGGLKFRPDGTLLVNGAPDKGNPVILALAIENGQFSILDPTKATGTTLLPITKIPTANKTASFHLESAEPAADGSIDVRLRTDGSLPVHYSFKLEGASGWSDAPGGRITIPAERAKWAIRLRVRGDVDKYNPDLTVTNSWRVGPNPWIEPLRPLFRHWLENRRIGLQGWAFNGSLLAIRLSTGRVEMWDVATEKLRGFLLSGTGADASHYCRGDQAFSPDGKTLAIGKRGTPTIELYNLGKAPSDPQQPQIPSKVLTLPPEATRDPLNASERGIVSIAFSGDSRTLAAKFIQKDSRDFDSDRNAGTSRTVLGVWSLPEGRLIHTRTIPCQEVAAQEIAVRPDGMAVGVDIYDKLHNQKILLVPTSEGPPIPIWQERDNAVRSLAFFSDCQRLLVLGRTHLESSRSDSDHYNPYIMKIGEPTRLNLNGGFAVEDISLSESGDLVMGREFLCDLLFWRPSDGRLLRHLLSKDKHLPNDLSDIHDFILSPDGRTVATSHWGINSSHLRSFQIWSLPASRNISVVKE